MRPRSVCESEAPTRQPLFEKLDASVETRSEPVKFARASAPLTRATRLPIRRLKNGGSRTPLFNNSRSDAVWSEF